VLNSSHSVAFREDPGVASIGNMPLPVTGEVHGLAAHQSGACAQKTADFLNNDWPSRILVKDNMIFAR
jgi:hypothetical protein